jgi:ABC-type transporter MlaC component
MIPFLAIHAKGGESMSPKQKDRTTTNFKNLVFKEYFQLVSYYVQKGEKVVFQNDISKPS